MRLVFICGCGHTGTTILTTMLSVHSEIYTPYVETWSYVWDEHKWILPTLYKEATRRKESVFLEKTPKHIYHVDKIIEDYDPKFIFCVRSGYDVVASLDKRYNDFNKALDRYIQDHNEVIKHDGKGLVVKYEDILDNPGAELEKICKHIELPYEKQMLNYHEMNLPQWSDVVDDPNALMRFEQIKKPIYRPKHTIDKTKCHTKEFVKIMQHFNYEV